jgi:AI-2 transport protein TqsA
MNGLKTNVFVIIASIVIIAAALMAAQSIILPIVLSLFISIICAQPILWLQKRRIPYALAMIIVLLSVSLLFLLFGGIIGNSIAQFTKDAPQYEEKLRQTVGSAVEQLNSMGANIDRAQIFDMFDLDKVLRFTTSAIGEIGRLMSNSFIIMLITIFMLLEMKSFILKAEMIEARYGNSLKHFDQIGRNIRSYLSIKTVISLITGVFIWLWLVIVGVDYAILWGVIAFLLNYIPSIGSIIAAVPTVLLALVQIGPGGMLWTGVGYLLVNTIMGSIIEPRVMGKGLGLSTLVVFLSLIIWGFMLGTVGMFLSVPLTMAFKIMLEQNEKTKWIAILLGTGQESRTIGRKKAEKQVTRTIQQI